MKPVKGWAIVNAQGNMTYFDYRYPITVLRRMAEKDRQLRCGGVGRVIKVEIREVVNSKGGGA